MSHVEIKPAAKLMKAQYICFWHITVFQTAVDIFTRPRISSSSAVALFMALMMSRFRKSICRLSSSRKCCCTTGAFRREYWQFHLQFVKAQKYKMRFPPLQQSLWYFQLLCVGLRTCKFWIVRTFAPKMSADCFLLTSIVHSTEKTEKEAAEAKKPIFSNCRFLSF